MAKISEEKIYLKTGESFKKVVTYSGGMFRIKLPEQLVRDLNLNGRDEDSVTGDTESEVNNKFRGKINDWINAIEKIEKIIFFKANFQGALLKKEHWNVFHGGDFYKPMWIDKIRHNNPKGMCEFCAEDLRGSDVSLGLTLEWGVFEKKDVAGKISYKFISGREMSDYHHDIKGYTEIPYSEEREQFFLQLDESFANMIAKVHKALGDLTPDKLIALSDSGMKLLGS